VHRRRPEIRLDHALVPLDLLRGSLRDLLAVVEHRHAVGDAHDDAHVMLDEQHGEPLLLAQPADERREVRRLLRVHARRRLVEQEQLRLRRERARDLEAALVAVREVLPDLVVLAAKPRELEQLARTLPRLALLAPHARRPRDRAEEIALESHVHADEHVLERSHVLKETDVLERAPDAPLRVRMRRLARHVLAVEEHAPGRRLVDAGQHVEERRLARSVRADQADDRAGGHGEVDVGDRDEAAELLAEAFGVEQRLRHRRSRGRTAVRRARSRAAPPCAASSESGPPAGRASRSR
jgi:hypothetical protein